MEIDGNTLIFIIVILYLFFSNPGGDGITSEYQFNQLNLLKNQLKTEYNSFQNTTYDSNFKNITGFKISYSDVLDNPKVNATYPLDGKNYNSWKPDEKHMLIPDRIINTINEKIWFRSNSDTSNNFPSNISSTIYGTIMNDINDREQISRIRMPIPMFYDYANNIADVNPPLGDEYLDDLEYSYLDKQNFTFPQGEISIELTHLDKISPNMKGTKEKYFNTQSDKWKFLKTKIIFKDKDEKEERTIYGKAVYDIQRGRIVSLTQSAKFHSLFAFPHYLSVATSNEQNIFNEVKQLVNDYWNASNYVDSFTMSAFEEWSKTAESSCEYMLFLQLEPWNQYTKDQLKTIDEELKWPMGRPTNLTTLPHINVKNGLLFSPDCGLQFRIESVEGVRNELQVRTTRVLLSGAILLVSIQIYLLLKQMQFTNTPSSINKISFYTLFILQIVDASLVTVFLIFAVILLPVFILGIVCLFLSFVLAYVFEIRYMMTVASSQANEQNVGIMTLLRSPGTGENEERRTIIADPASVNSGLLGKVYFSLLTFTFFISTASTWTKSLRGIIEYIILFAMNSYWIPQVFRNAIKGIQSRSMRANQNSTMQRQNGIPFLWQYIIGTSIVRILPIFYLFAYPSNIFRHHTDYKFVIFLCAWLKIQILMLCSQDYFGARWFLPKHVIPEGYSYHRPVLGQELLEHGASENHGIDCAICMTDVPVYVEDIPETHQVDMDSYMVTPCDHIFHTTCLENWMGYKLQCPVCRAPIPPL